MGVWRKLEKSGENCKSGGEKNEIHYEPPPWPAASYQSSKANKKLQHSMQTTPGGAPCTVFAAAPADPTSSNPLHGCGIYPAYL
jgi:hypothetical protein